MNSIRESKKTTLIFIYLYAFFVFYMPELNGILGIRSHILLTGLLFILIPFFVNGKLNVNKELFYLCVGIVISSVFFGVRALTSGNELRFLQNNFIIIQAIHISFIIKCLRQKGYTKDDQIKFILNIALFQSFICILMLIIPPFREIALNLYYNGKQENIYISASRIYGISGDYTFFTPVFHGLLSVVASVYAILKNYKYLYYIPFFLISILLNGRIGLIVFAFGMMSALLVLLFRGKSISKIIIYVFSFIMTLTISLFLIKFIVPNTFYWIQSGLQDTLALFSDNKLSGNYESLLNTMLYWPEGTNLIWGEGYRVYGEFGLLHGKIPSDIGFVNDMFMGGILYIVLLYGAIIRFVLKKNKNTNQSSRVLNIVLSVSMLTVLLISNYKGESMKSGLILLGVIYLKLIISDDDSNTKRLKET